MRSENGRFFAWTLLLVTLFCVGCTEAVKEHSSLAVDASLELVFTRGCRELVLVGADGENPMPLLSSDTALIAPRFSPCGQRLAFYDIGTPDLPVSSTRVALAVVRVDGAEDSEENAEGAPEIASVSFELPQFDVDHRLMIDDAIPPIWEPGGESLIVAHNNGIERVALSGERSDLVEGEPVAAAALFPEGGRIVYSNGTNVFVLGPKRGEREALLGDGFVPRFGNRRIRAVAVSPDGREIAFGLGRDVFALDVAAKSVRRAFDARHAVYWIAYLSGGKELVALAGKEDRRRALVSPWASVMGGEYSLVVGAVGGGSTRKLFSAHLVDVRDARPDLSPDGRFVSVAVQDGAVKEIVLVATDGSGAMKLASHGPGAFASWRPMR